MIETLECREGKHDWERPRTRGRKPANCPEHPTLPGVSSMPSELNPSPALPHSCSGCECRWGGLNTSHCGSGCHLTFSTVANFDRHRSAGKCRVPSAKGVELVLLSRDYPCYGQPGDDDAIKKMYAARSPAAERPGDS